MAKRPRWFHQSSLVSRFGYEALPYPRSALSRCVLPDQAKPIEYDDIDGNQPIEAETRNSVGPRSKCVSRPYVMKHDVPDGMQRPSCGKPVRGATQTEKGQ